MTMDRRLLLKSMAIAGMLMPRWRLGHASNSINNAKKNVVVVPLVCANRLSADFLTDVKIEAANRGWSMKQAIHLQGLDGTAYQVISDLVHLPFQVVLVGLLDDAWTALLHDLVRSGGGQMLSGQTNDFCCTFKMEET